MKKTERVLYYVPIALLTLLLIATVLDLVLTLQLAHTLGFDLVLPR